MNQQGMNQLNQSTQRMNHTAIDKQACYCQGH